MAHNEHVFPRGFWPRHIVPTPSKLTQLDQVTSEALNGTNGGNYNPTSPIYIGGSGIDIRGTNSILSGTLVTDRGSRGIRLGQPSVRPSFVTARTRTVVFPLTTSNDFDAYYYQGAYSSSNNRFVHIDTPYFGVQPIAGGGSIVFRGRFDAKKLNPGATALFFRLRFRVLTSPFNIISNTPTFYVFRQGRQGNRLTDITPTNNIDMSIRTTRANATAYTLHDRVRLVTDNNRTYTCVTAGTSGGSEAGFSTTYGSNQPDGTVMWRVHPGFTTPYEQPTPVLYPPFLDLAQYYNLGAPQEIVVKVNLNGVIDTANYDYCYHIVDPGPSLPTDDSQYVYHSIVAELGSIPDMREP